MYNMYIVTGSVNVCVAQVKSTINGTENERNVCMYGVLFQCDPKTISIYIRIRKIQY